VNEINEKFSSGNLKGFVMSQRRRKDRQDTKPSKYWAMPCFSSSKRVWMSETASSGQPDYDTMGRFYG
jgi:hypothetical protein